MRSQMRTGSWARGAAKAAGVPVYAVKNGSSSHLLRALEILLGLQPSAGSLFDSGSSSDDESVQYQNHVVSMVSFPLSALIGWCVLGEASIGFRV